MATKTTLTAPATPRKRVLDTATRLFYAEGVHAVGIDRIIAEAGVAKATFYHHFPSKDDLVRAYVDEQCRLGKEKLVSSYVEEQSKLQRAAADQIRTATARDTVLGIFEIISTTGPDYRGCPFVNVAAEYPDRLHPVRQAVADYRRWFRGLLRDLLAAAGHPDVERTADVLVALSDGVLIGCDLDDPAVLRGLVHDAVTRILEGPAHAEATAST